MCCEIILRLQNDLPLLTYVLISPKCLRMLIADASPAYRRPHFDVICWGQVEATVGLMVACAPSIRSFFTRPTPRPRGQQSDNNGQQYWLSTSGPASDPIGSRANPHSTPGSSMCNGVDVDLATSHAGQEYGLAYPYPKGGAEERESMMDGLQLDGIVTARGYIQHEEEIYDGMEHKTKHYPRKRGEYLDETKVSTKSNGSSIGAFTANSSEGNHAYGELCHARDGSAVSEISLRRDYANETSK